MTSSGELAPAGAECRLCPSPAHAAPRLKLFPNVAASSEHSAMSAHLLLLTGLTIQVNDGLPQAICRNCNELVISALLLRKQSALTEKKLLQMGYVKLNRKPIKMEPITETAIKNVNIDSSPVIPSFQEDDKVFSANFLLKDENKSVKVSDTLFQEDDEVFPVDLLLKDENESVKISDTLKDITKGDKAKSKNLLKSQAAEKVRKENYLEKLKKCEEFSDGPLNVEGPIHCKICKRVSATIKMFYAHLRIHIGFDHVCEFCGKKFYAAINLRRHCMSWHGLQKDCCCTQCDYKAVSTSRLREHLRTHTGERPYECDICGTKFHTRSSIVQHLEIHFARKTIQCEKCPSMFKNRRALSTHVNRTHIRDYLYLCYLCDKRYLKNTSARKHLSRHHGVPRDQQGKIPRFSRSKALIVN